jgi:HD-like signal output (HDOD) protein
MKKDLVELASIIQNNWSETPIDKTLQQIIFNMEHIGSPRGISFKLIQKTSGDAYNAEDLAGLLSQDPTICAQILKVANSAFFSPGRPIKTIKHAVTHLGLANIKNIIFAIEILGVFKGRLASETFNATDFWKHSIAGGIIASNYAKVLGSNESDLFYITAILRNLGVLALRQFMPEAFDKILSLVRRDQIPFEAACKAIVNASHREITSMIGLSWNLPAVIVDAINDRVNPFEISKEASDIRKAIAFADDLLHDFNFGVWDPYYKKSHIVFQDIPREDYIKNAATMIDAIHAQLFS